MKNKVIAVCLKAMFQQLPGRNEDIDENHLTRKIIVRIGSRDRDSNSESH